LKTHSIFISNALNATPVWKQIAIIFKGIIRFEERLNFMATSITNSNDGSHISIYLPSENSAHYVNHKNFHSINLLAVVDYKRHFTYLHARKAGDLYSLKDDELDNSANSDNESVLVINETREETVSIQKKTGIKASETKGLDAKNLGIKGLEANILEANVLAIE
ncbi:6968_t:CDS:2, partial [Cetraspora pellucida]